MGAILGKKFFGAKFRPWLQQGLNLLPQPLHLGLTKKRGLMPTPKPAKTTSKSSTKKKIQDLLEEIKTAQKGKKTPKYRAPTQLTLF